MRRTYAKALILGLASVILSACDIEIVPVDSQPTQTSAPSSSRAVTSRSSMRSFAEVQRRVEPVAEQMCRANTRGVNCDFRIIVDDRANQPPNAFQTLDENKRPIIGFTASLIEDTRNQDELAFIMGHEAAHHIQGHIAQSQQSALEGAVAATILAQILGASAANTELAQRAGATVNARRFSKEFELEADSLGTVIAARAGYNPVRGAEYFNRIPDPGNQFLGTHPPNAERIQVVRRTAARL
ncbi:MAG: M48 family metallopeptidase [Pseudomonadota bacterium]